MRRFLLLGLAGLLTVAANAQFVQQGGKLAGSDAVQPAYQGSGVALSADGNTALVGGYDDANYAGAAWVYTRSGGVWASAGRQARGRGFGSPDVPGCSRGPLGGRQYGAGRRGRRQRVPFGVSPGNTVPVMLNIGGKSSNTATIAVQ